MATTIGGGGQFLDRVHNDVVFDQVLTRMQRLPGLDPSLAFEQALPGWLAEVTQQEGPWPGRDTKRWVIDGKSEIARAIAPDQKARMGGVSERHIVAVRGVEIAGVSQKVGLQDFQYGGLTMAAAERKALLPLRSFNERVSKTMMDVATSGDYSGSPTVNFAWAVPDQDGATATVDLATATANQVADVYINGSQSTFIWPLRTGAETATGHSHVVDAGATWTLAQQATARDNVQEHPGMGRVTAYVGATVAAAVRAQAKTEYGAIIDRVQLIQNAPVRDSGGFGYMTPMGISMDSIDYVYVPDMPTSTSVTVANNQKPFHLEIGAVGADGNQLGRGAWSDKGDQERLGTYYGFRDYISAGVRNPMAVVVTEHAA